MGMKGITSTESTSSSSKPIESQNDKEKVSFSISGSLQNIQSMIQYLIMDLESILFLKQLSRNLI